MIRSASGELAIQRSLRVRKRGVHEPFASFARRSAPAAFAALLGPRERKKGANSRTPAVFNHPRALPQGHCRFGPALAGSMVGRHRDLEILGASHVLDDALAVVGTPVDAEREVILWHRPPSRASASARLSTSFGSTSKTELLTEASALGGPPPGWVPRNQ
jgi:hypothetical protein